MAQRARKPGIGLNMQRAGTVCSFVCHTEGGKLYKRALDLTKRTANNSNVMQETGQNAKLQEVKKISTTKTFQLSDFTKHINSSGLCNEF